MADYRITSPMGVIRTSDSALITPMETDDWAVYQAWLDAGNSPDLDTGLPSQSLTVSDYTITADATDSSTISGIINPSTVVVTMPAGSGIDNQAIAVTDGSLVFKTPVAGDYDFVVQTDGYLNETFTITAS